MPALSLGSRRTWHRFTSTQAESNTMQEEPGYPDSGVMDTMSAENGGHDRDFPAGAGGVEEEIDAGMAFRAVAAVRAERP